MQGIVIFGMIEPGIVPMNVNKVSVVIVTELILNFISMLVPEIL